MDKLMYRAMVLVGDVCNAVADVLPGRGDDWLERDYDAAVARTEVELAEDGGEALEPWAAPPPRTVDHLGADERDTEWVSSYGGRWRWGGDRWERRFPADDRWHPVGVGYTPQSSGPFTAVDAQSLEWEGWAVPAILEVLAETTSLADPGREGLAVEIAQRIACDPQRAIEALSHYKPDKV